LQVSQFVDFGLGQSLGRGGHDRQSGGAGKGGTATITADGKEVAKGRVERTTPIRFSLDEGMDIGEDTGTPVSLDYDVPNKFTGHFETVTINIKPGDRAAIEAGNKANQTAAIRRTLRD